MKFSPGCKCCECVATSGHRCVCTCFKPTSVTGTIEDDNGSHTLEFATFIGPLGGWLATYVLTGVAPQAVDPESPFACFTCPSPSCQNVVVRYELIATCPAIDPPNGSWTLSLTVGFERCTNDGGSTYVTIYSENIELCNTSTSGAGNTIFSDTIPFQCDTSALTFTLPTSYSFPGTTNSLPLLGGGGTITVVL